MWQSNYLLILQSFWLAFPKSDHLFTTRVLIFIKGSAVLVGSNRINLSSLFSIILAVGWAQSTQIQISWNSNLRSSNMDGGWQFFHIHTKVLIWGKAKPGNSQHSFISQHTEVCFTGVKWPSLTTHVCLTDRVSCLLSEVPAGLELSSSSAR